MTIECYLFLCPNHCMHTDGPDEGPFCYQEQCTVSARYIRYTKEFQDTAIQNQKTLKAVPLIPIKLINKR